jgi:exopolysaccharide production protein ExoQ
VMVLVVLTDHDPLEAIYTVLRRVLFVIIPLSVVFVKYYRDIGTSWDYLGNEMWVGVTTHKNELGQVAMIAGVYSVIEIMRHWRKNSWRSMSMWIYILLLMMTVWLLIGSPTSRSTTSMLLFIAGIMIILSLHFMKSKAAYIGRYIVIGSFILGIIFIGYQAFTARSVVTSAVEASGRDSTLTGRTELWEDVLLIASAHPILGVGYGSFWIGNTRGLWDKHIWGPTQGHNGYIDVYVELGIVGLFIFGGLILSTYRNILNEFKLKFDSAAFRLTLLVILLCHNLTESSFLRGTVSMWFLFLLVVLNISDRTKMQWKQTAR